MFSKKNFKFLFTCSLFLMTSVVVTKARASSLSESIQPVIDQEMAIMEINVNNIIIQNSDNAFIEADNKLCIKCNRFIVKNSKITLKAKKFSLKIGEVDLDENSSFTLVKK